MAPSAYIPDARSKGNRLAKRTTYDAPLIHSIINTVPILHVSFNAPTKDPSEPQFPTILPMLGAIGQSPSDEDDHLYLHGSTAARLFRLTESGTQELPLTVAATHFDGYVLALAPFHNSCNYRSAVCFGYGSLVEDPDEIDFALRIITNNSIPQRWERSRQPPTKSELTSTGVLKVRIETASAKTRSGGPGDEKADLSRPELVGNIWTGVVPAYVTLGEPVAGSENQVERVPEYLEDWVQDVNSRNEQRAVDAALEG